MQLASAAGALHFGAEAIDCFVQQLVSVLGLIEKESWPSGSFFAAR